MTIDVEQLEQRKDQVQLVDVREDSEWEAGHIDGAIHIPLGRLSAELDSLDRERPVVTYCRTGPRSERGAQTLKAAGLQADYLRGGVTAWHRSGRNLVDHDGGPGSVEGMPSEEPVRGSNPELESFQDDFLAIAMALNERFGGREPTDEEAKSFMREWLQDKGTPPEEIERILSE
ncbi:MAG TPA: rhodanese-like domain-containing protein [Actinomycetota bacterium]|nr:rhodanese-like domain-containing protein [Actinomycetota bacterium]